MERQIFSSGIQVGHNQPAFREMRDALKSDPVAFHNRFAQAVESGKIGWHTIRDLKQFFAYTADIQMPITMDVGGSTRALYASAFPVLTGTMTIKTMNDAYLNYPAIGGNLVTEMDDNKKVTSVSAIHNHDKNIDEVKDTEDFPEISADEEKVEIRHRQNGRMLTIHQNLIDENEIGDIVSRINGLGIIAADWIEEQTLKRATDYDGSKASPAEPFVYRPNGTGTALFSATANTPGVREPLGTCVQNNAFADETDLEAARIRLLSMKNMRGKRINIPWSEVVILAPCAIENKILQVLNSIYVPGVLNEKSSYGPEGKYYLNPNGKLWTSPKLDDLSTSAWYCGAPRRQFIRKWKLRFEYVTLGTDTESYLRRRIAFQARIAWDCEIGATDYVYWVQNLAATTFPADA